MQATGEITSPLRVRVGRGSKYADPLRGSSGYGEADARVFKSKHGRRDAGASTCHG